ncbi:MAG: DUF1579 family protein [Candidatus Sulfotelmatobacter sp.]
MKHIGILMLMLAATCLAVGQGTSAQPPKPGPEHQKLAGLVGNWTTEGEMTENPLGPAEKWSGTIKSEWFSGNFAVVRHTDEKFSVSGETHALEVIAYDKAAKTYTWYGVNSQGGGGDLGKASISGDVLTAVWEFQFKGKAYKFRGTVKGLGSDRLTFVGEYSEDGTAWKAYLHSTDTRVKSK